MDSDTRTWNRLYELLAEDSWDQIVYGYRVDRFGQPIKPYLFKWGMHSNLIESIREDFGGGEYRLLVRGSNNALQRHYWNCGTAAQVVLDRQTSS